MYVDNLTLLWDSAALSTDAVSTNTYDRGLANNYLGQGTPVGAVLVVEVAADFTSADETYKFSIIQSANANLSSGDLLVSETFLGSALTLGKIVHIPLPNGSVTKRYLGLDYDGSGTTPTVTVSAWFTMSQAVERLVRFALGFTVS